MNRTENEDKNDGHGVASFYKNADLPKPNSSNGLLLVSQVGRFTRRSVRFSFGG
jgi:hypothetical protein